jgi:hypothetical protein
MRRSSRSWSWTRARRWTRCAWQRAMPCTAWCQALHMIMGGWPGPWLPRPEGAAHACPHTHTSASRSAPPHPPPAAMVSSP